MQVKNTSVLEKKWKIPLMGDSKAIISIVKVEYTSIELNKNIDNDQLAQ